MKRTPTEQSGNVFEANKTDRDLVTQPESVQRVARMIEMDQQYLVMAKERRERNTKDLEWAERLLEWVGRMPPTSATGDPSRHPGSTDPVRAQDAQRSWKKELSVLKKRRTKYMEELTSENVVIGYLESHVEGLYRLKEICQKYADLEYEKARQSGRGSKRS